MTKATASKKTGVTKYQNTDVVLIPRTQIKEAFYNPRDMDPFAAKKLRKHIKKHGLQGTIVINKTTGNVVSGHQRLAALDFLEGSTDYELGVSIMELTEKQEREQNVYFNNPAAQGQFDITKLAEVLKFDGIDLEETAFDFTDIQLMFDDPELTKAFQPPEEVEKAEATLEQIAGMKAKKREHRVESRDEQDLEWFAVVIFETRAQREAFMLGAGSEIDDRYVDGKKLADRLSIDISTRDAVHAEEKAELLAKAAGKVSREIP